MFRIDGSQLHLLLFFFFLALNETIRRTKSSEDDLPLLIV